MRYKTQLFIILLIALGLTACQRGRLRQDTDTTSPVPVESTQTVAAPIQQPTSTQLVVTAATLPPSIPTPTPIPATLAPDLSSDLSELDEILNELDEVLGGTNTDVNIP
jgi:hypothetical protein